MLDKIDFLSPSITLFYFERRSHTSKIGGSLGLIMVSLCLLYASYIVYITLAHKRVTSIFYKKFEWEAGYYSLNSSSIFNFFQILRIGGYFDDYNPKYIYSYITYANSHYKETELDKYEHWVFDKCKNILGKSEFDQSLITNIENFNNSACIKYYYNCKEKKYYSIGQKEFVWPHLEHGASRKDNIYLVTSIQKCFNNSILNKLFGECLPEEEIDRYIDNYVAISFYFADIQINPLNYKRPIEKYLNTITSNIATDYTYVENYVHFSPLKIKTKEGGLFPKINEHKSFYFDTNLKGSAYNLNKYYTLAKYYYLMQNNVQIYERSYNDLFDIMAQIGGGVQLLYYIFFWINYIYNRFIITYDTNKLFFNAKETKENIPKKEYLSNKYLKNNNLNNGSNISEDYNLNQSKNFLNLKVCKNLNNDTISFPMSYNSNNKMNLNIIRSPKKEKNDINNNNLIIKDNPKKPLQIQINDNKLSFIPKTKKNSVFSIFDNKKDISASPQYQKMKELRISHISVRKIDHQKTIFENLIKEERLKFIQNLTFFIFIKSFFINKYKGTTDFIRLFRKNLLSEEHFFKSHIKISLLEKQYKLNKNQNISFIDCFNNL